MSPVRRPGKRPLRFLVDTNVFVAAAKSSFKRQKKPNSLTLLLYLINEESVQLVGSELLEDEYKRYSTLSPTARQIFTKLLEKMRIVEYDKLSIDRCLPLFRPSSISDAMHAAICLREKATLITNDDDFDRIRREGLITIWSTSEAIRRLLYTF